MGNVNYLERLEGRKLKVFVNHVGKYSYFPAMSLGTETFFLVEAVGNEDGTAWDARHGFV